MSSAAEPTAQPTSQPSFQQAMEITAQWLALWEAGELSEEVLADRVGELVASRDGARGFFVVALAGESPLLDRLPEALLLQLRRAGASVVDLTARNLAMSTAMALAHGRSGDPDQQAGSLRVQARATELLRHLEPQAVRERLETLLAAARSGITAGDAAGDAIEVSADSGNGSGANGNGSAPDASIAIRDDRAFLERWGYDGEQRVAIAAAIEAVAEPG